MARVAFPSYDVLTIDKKGGGVGAFIVHFARQLRAQGDEVTIFAITGGTKPASVDPEWLDKYRSWGIDVVHVSNELDPDRWPNSWTVLLSEKLTPLLRDFDIVYFSDWGNVAFNTVRTKRLGATPMPVCVTVLHGASSWLRILDGGTLTFPDHLVLDFVERYSASNSDYVIAPSRRIAEWVREQGWQLGREAEILGLPFLPEHRLASERRVTKLTRLVFFGRLDRRKGIDLFASAVLRLHQEAPEALAQLEEVVLLGYEVIPGKADEVRRTLLPTGLPVIHIGDLNSGQAQDYLAEHAADMLLVVSSPFENFPYAVIEPSLIPGLNLICTRGGGTPEVFAGRGERQLFDPTLAGLVAKIRECLNRPLTRSELVQYDFAAHNERWLEFHNRIKNTVRAGGPSLAAPESAVVDVCVAFFNKGRHFPQLLNSLELQTFQNFRVIAVDDGSTDADSASVFDAMAERYRARGWIFFRQDNQFVDAARNRAAERATAEYLLFVDADDVLAANAIERLVQSAQRSGDDCLTAGLLRFSGDQFPYDRRTGRPTTPIMESNMPLGAALAAALSEPSVLGASPILVRRSAFEAVGGFRELRGAAHEDWELYVKLTARGFRTDVVPEFLYYYRQSPDSLSRHVDRGLSKRRLEQQFDWQLGSVGLPHAASIIRFNSARIRERADYAHRLSQQLRISYERFNAFGFAPLEASLTARQHAGATGRAAHLPRRKNVLVIIPTLDLGGAEMDLLRNLPRLDRDRFRIVVFTFLARGALAPQLAAAGIEIAGPFVALRFFSFRDIKRLAGIVLHRSRLAASRWKNAIYSAVARLAPEMVRDVWRSFRTWLRLRRRRRSWTQRLRRFLKDVWTATRGYLAASRDALSRGLANLRGRGRQLVRLLPPPILTLIHDVIAWLVYTIVGIGLAPLIRARRIDLVHTVLPNSYVVGSIANFWSNRPLIMSRVGLNWHQQTRGLYRFVERQLCHGRVAAAVANCQVIRDELRIEGIAERKLHLIENGIDVADFSWRMVDRDGARVSLGLPPTAIVITVVANLHPYKGHADLLRALHTVSKDMPDWVLLAVGRDVDGNKARLGKLSVECGISNRVRFLDERMDVPAILSAADIHVSSSHTEGLPNNILEAMCARLPVIATDVGGVGEMVVDRRSGILVPARDPAALGRAIVELAHDRTARRRMGEYGRRRVSSNFTIDRSVAAFERLYSEVASQGDAIPGEIGGAFAAQASPMDRRAS